MSQTHNDSKVCNKLKLEMKKNDIQLALHWQGSDVLIKIN